GNCWEVLSVRGVPLVAIGHEGPWFRPAPDLTGLPESGFRLLLSHTPDNFAWAVRNRIDLVLAGDGPGGRGRGGGGGWMFVAGGCGCRWWVRSSCRAGAAGGTTWGRSRRDRR